MCTSLQNHHDIIQACLSVAPAGKPRTIPVIQRMLPCEIRTTSGIVDLTGTTIPTFFFLGPNRDEINHQHTWLDPGRRNGYQHRTLLSPAFNQTSLSNVRRERKKNETPIWGKFLCPLPRGGTRTSFPRRGCVCLRRIPGRFDVRSCEAETEVGQNGAVLVRVVMALRPKWGRRLKANCCYGKNPLGIHKGQA